jgi:hypothetical protein
MKQHPEQQDDELYMGNQPMLDADTPMPPMQVGWRSARLGVNVYGAEGLEGQLLPRYRPIFIKRSEIEAAMVTANEESRAIYQRMLDSGGAI